jgi:hypothetical protein
MTAIQFILRKFIRKMGRIADYIEKYNGGHAYKEV